MTLSVRDAQLRVESAKTYVRTCERNVTFANNTREVRAYNAELMGAQDELAEAYAALVTAQKASSVMGSSAVAGLGLQVASAGLGRAFPTEVSYGAPIAAAFAVQNAAQAGLFGAGALSGLGSALDGAASSMGGSYGGTSAPSYGAGSSSYGGSPAYDAAYGDSGAVGRAASGSAYGGSPAYDAVYRVSGSVGMGSSSYGGRAASGSAYGGSPAFEALYGDSRPSAAIIAQKAQILKQMDAVTVEMNQLLAKEAKAERRAAAMDRIRESNAAFEAREAQEQAEAKEAQKQARVEAKANIRARVDAKAQRQAEAEAQATERARAAAPAPARARAPAESYNPLNPFGATWY